MPEALIKIKDVENGEVELEVKFNPEIVNNSPSHQLVADFISFHNMKKVEDKNKG
jgi:hypothetical protein